MRNENVRVTMRPDLVERLNERAAMRTHKGQSRPDLSREIGHIVGHHLSAVRMGRRALAGQLSKAELFAVLDVMNGTHWDASVLPMMMQGGISANVSDGCALDGLHDKWGVDREHLCVTVAELGSLETYALLDLVRGAWNHCEGDWQEMFADFSGDAPASTPASR